MSAKRVIIIEHEEDSLQATSVSISKPPFEQFLIQHTLWPEIEKLMVDSSVCSAQTLQIKANIHHQQ